MAHENLYVRIPVELSDRLEEYLKKTNRSKVSVVIEALEKFLKREEASGNKNK